MKLSRVVRWLCGLVWMAGLAAAPAEDWPQWRFNASRSAYTSESLPDTLELQWVRQFPSRVQAWEDPLNQDLMSYDRIFEPVVLGGRMFIGFNDSDKVMALDTATGRELWTFYTEGPVRLPAAAWEGRVYFSSDDGCLYCLDAAQGTLLWKHRGGPSARKVLGNQRVISAWPARGGPVVRDGRVYYAASIWPFMGTYVFALDAKTGALAWANDSTGSQFIKQPHSAPSFAGVAPQGPFAATRDFLLVPGGRSVPAVFDRKTGRFLYYQLEDSGKGNGGSFVVANESSFFVHTRQRGTRGYDLKDGRKTTFTINEPVLGSQTLYSAQDHSALQVTVLEAEQKLLSAQQGVADAQAEVLKTEEEGDAAAVKKAVTALADARKKVPKAETTLATARKALGAGWAGPVLQAVGLDRKLRWEFPADARGDLIKCAGRLYAAHSNAVYSIEPPVGVGRARMVWSNAVSGRVLRLLAANGRLFAVTLDGRILAYGRSRTNPAPAVVAAAAPQVAPIPAAVSARARSMLDQSGAREGYALWFGIGDGLLLEAALRESSLNVAAVDGEGEGLGRIRARLDAQGLYGRRAAVHAGNPAGFKAPPYIASLVVVGEPWVAALADGETLRAVYESVRPYGGVLWIQAVPPVAEAIAGYIQSARLAGARVAVVNDGVRVIRQGPLPGAADWTHQYGDSGNTVKSDDQLVKLPLGLLWFGGNTHQDVLPRHGHGPSEQVAGGRLFLEGMSGLSARDVYTGRVLWKREFGDLGNDGIYFDATYTNLPLTTSYNQKHIPGANARGANFVATPEAVYLLVSNACQVLDARDGHTRLTISLPPRAGGGPAQWGYLGVCGDVLLAGSGFAQYTSRLGLSGPPPPLVASNTVAASGATSAVASAVSTTLTSAVVTAISSTATSAVASAVSASGLPPGPRPVPVLDYSASRSLVALDRHTGKVLWSTDARHSFLHNGIVAGNDRVFCIDKLPKSVEDKLKRRGRPSPKDYRLTAYDLRTGAMVWQVQTNISGTWLGYSRQNDVLLQAGASATDRLKDEAEKGLAIHSGLDGSLLWRRPELKYTGPCILYHDMIITTPGSYKTNAGAYGLLDGQPRFIMNPLTGQTEPWRVYRTYGCNYPVAGEHLMTFRSGAAGFYDLDTHSGTGNFGGFKSGCSANLIAADGVLNAPDYTRTCSCPYQNQTSLAFVHQPGLAEELELWTHNQYGAEAKEGIRIRRVGLNLGAPGDRLAPDGTLWLDCPSVGGNSPHLAVVIKGKTNTFRRHVTQFNGAGPAWVMASGITGLDSITIQPETRKAPTAPPAPKKKAEDEDEDDKHDKKTEEDNKARDAASAKASAGERYLSYEILDKSRRYEWTDPAAAARASRLVTNKIEPVYKSVLPSAPYTVRLYFAEPEDIKPGERVFSVSIQGRSALRDLDVLRQTGGARRGLVHEFRGVIVKDQLVLAFARAPQMKFGPLLCGVEMILEEALVRDGGSGSRPGGTTVLSP